MARRESVWPPVAPALALALLGVLLIVLRIDANLGLTAFAVTAEVATPVIGLTSRPASLLADVVTALVVLMVVLLLGAVRRPRRLGSTAVLLFLVAGAALQSGTRVAQWATGSELPTDLYVARSLLLAGTTVAALRVLGPLVRHRATVEALVESTARVETLERSARTALTRLRKEVSAEVSDVLDDALATLEAGAGHGSALRLRALADEVLRPLSHRLAGSPAALESAVSSVAPPSWRETLVAVARTPVLPARSLALVAAGLAAARTFVSDQETVQAIVPDGGAAAVVGGVGLTVAIDWVPVLAVFGELGLVLLVTWWGGARLAAILERRRPRPTPAVAWSATSLAVAAVASLTLVGPAFFAWLAGVTAPSLDAVRFLASFLPLLAVTLGVSVTVAVEDGREALESDLARQRDDLARAAARLQAVVAHEQHRLARTLHSDVQAAVNAAGLVLDRTARDGDGTVPTGVIEDVAGRIATSVERFLRGSSSGEPIVDRLDQIRALWQGVCTVTTELVEDVADRVDGDAVTRDLVVDLIAEACANAVVHGGAATVRVRLALDEDGDVTLVVEDDGTQEDDPGRGTDAPVGDRARGREGLGSAVLRASCTRFALSREAEGHVLTASIPLD